MWALNFSMRQVGGKISLKWKSFLQKKRAQKLGHFLGLKVFKVRPRFFNVKTGRVGQQDCRKKIFETRTRSNFCENICDATLLRSFESLSRVQVFDLTF